MEENIIAGFVLICWGVLNVVKPGLLIRFQIWSQRVIMGAKYEPSERTYNVVKIMGVIFILLGMLAITGILK